MTQEETAQKMLFELIGLRVIEPHNAQVLSDYIKQAYAIGFDLGANHYYNEGNKPVLMINKNGIIEQEFKSISQAAKTTGITRPNIGQAASNEHPERKTAGGYIWRFKNI